MKTILSVPQDPQTLADWCGVNLLGKSRAAVTVACTDSREAEPGSLFCAIRGERTDGHDYLPAAYAAGSRCFLCERIPADAPAAFPDACFLRVPDTVAALSRLAAGFRATCLPEMRVVAVTGSVGKTTTKELCAAVLRTAAPTFCRAGNFNSVIGMPLSVLGIGTDVRTAVLEMGMSARGEISAMSQAAHPDLAIITNIGSSHLEHLGTRENIARAKLEIMDGMLPGGRLLFDGDEPLLRAEMPHRRPDIQVHSVSLTDPTADFLATDIRPEADGTVFSLRLPTGTVWSRLRIPALLSRPLVQDAAYAAGVGFLTGMSQEAVMQGLSGYRPAAMRLNRHCAGGVTVLEDCYNAAPESVQAALDTLPLLAAQTGGRRMALLGDMKELGNDTVALHRKTGAACADRLDRLWTVGALGAEIAVGAREAGMQAVSTLNPKGDTADAEAIAAELLSELEPGDILLIKASRAMHLEAVTEEILRDSRAK